jgi:tetratricopeptide (TPR) repeat protein
MWTAGVVANNEIVSDFEPSDTERGLARLFRAIEDKSPTIRGVDPLVDAFCEHRWGEVLARVEQEHTPLWFSAIAVALKGEISEIIAHAEGAPHLQGHMAAFRGLARREMYLIPAAFADLKQAVANLPAAQRATHYRTLAELAYLMGDSAHAVELLAWALPRLKDDSEFARAATELMRFGGFAEAEHGLEARTLRGDAPPRLWLLRARLALWIGASDAARELVNRAEASSEDDKVQARICLAIADFLDGADEHALDGFTSVEHVGDREAHAFSAELLKRLGQDELAVNHLETSALTAQNTVHTLLRCVVYDDMQESGRAQLAAQEGITDEAEQTVDAARRALRTFHGNRGAVPTRTRTPQPVSSASFLECVPTPPTDIKHTSRNASASVLKKLRTQPVSDVHAEFAALQKQYPESAHPFCYWGELLLWEGRFDDAFAAFSANRGAQIARWGYVGRAAVEVHRGDFERALWEFRELTTRYEPVRGATTHVYMGELARIRGEYERGLAELKIAIGAKNGRIGARLNRVLCWLGLGDRDAAADEFGRLCDQWPGPFWHAANALGVPWDQRATAPAEIALKSLELMRGNRSSHLHTFFDLQGTMRFTADVHAWSKHFDRSKSHLRWGAIETMLCPPEPQ